MPSARPDLHICIGLKPALDGTRSKVPLTQVGVGWTNTSGSISLKLNVGVVLDWRMMETHTVLLLPVQEDGRSRTVRRPSPGPGPSREYDGDGPVATDDDHPF
jgi:hypothetical protein